MRVEEVKSVQQEKEFIHLPVRLYKDDSNWIRPLDDDIQQVFDPERNKHFRHGEATRWLLYDANDKVIGRVAAFIDHNISNTYDQPTGGMGFFECVNNRDAAFLLFDTARLWLLERGMEAMDGPVNFGDRDKWWGLLVDGFYPPNYCMPYNFPYYQDFFEAYGFQNYFEQYTFHRQFANGDIGHYMQLAADRIAQNPRYTITHINKKDLDRYAEEFRHVYNRAWTRHGGVKEITSDHARALLKTMKPILDERLIWFAYYDDEPVGFFIMIPEMNQVFRFVNGKMNLLGKLKVLWYLKVRKVATKALGLVFGIVADHQRKGVEAALLCAFRDMVNSSGVPYREAELNWIGDFNPTMIRIARMVGCQVKKTHITYRYLFDREKPFVRAKRVS